MESYYFNRGEKRKLIISNHAINRLSDRMEAIKNNCSGLWCLHDIFTSMTIVDFLEYLIRNSHKVIFDSQTLKRKKRSKNYNSTLVFRKKPFDLIIEDGILKTVEISDNDLRWLNKY